MIFFKTTFDPRMHKSFTALQKFISAIRQLAYGNTADALDEYLSMSERVSRESLYNFYYGIVKLYLDEYLRKPTSNDIQLLYAAHQTRHEFPVMLEMAELSNQIARPVPNM